VSRAGIFSGGRERDRETKGACGRCAFDLSRKKKLGSKKGTIAERMGAKWRLGDADAARLTGFGV